MRSNVKLLWKSCHELSEKHPFSFQSCWLAPEMHAQLKSELFFPLGLEQPMNRMGPVCRFCSGILQLIPCKKQEQSQPPWTTSKGLNLYSSGKLETVQGRHFYFMTETKWIWRNPFLTVLEGQIVIQNARLSVGEGKGGGALAALI